MWHSATYRGDELIVLGHDPRRNDCMLVRLSGLPMNEQHDLRRIAASRSAQESSHLIPILRRMPSPDGSDWFTYLTMKMQQRNSPVFTLPIKEVQDTLDQDQKAIFKGYGKGRRNTSLDREDFARDHSGESDLDDMDADYPAVKPEKSTANDSLNNKIDLLIETLSDENRRTQTLLTKLIGALSKEDAAPKRTAKARPSRRHDRAEKHDTPSTALPGSIDEVPAYEA